MKPTVFYSWQSDVDRKPTRDIIHNAALEAIRRHFKPFALEESPRLDHDTDGEPGAPDIAATIYGKIKESGVFLADVTLVGQTWKKKENGKFKLLPNPNVLVELGYAAAILGWDRMILVMNTEHGHPEELPFDLRSRRFPITFKATTDSSTHADATSSLADDLHHAIGVCLQADNERVETTLTKLNSYARGMMVKWGQSPSFWETTPDNKMLSRQDLAIQQFLDLGIVRCINTVGEAGFQDVYEWTYLGRQCITKLGVALPPVATESQHQRPQVITNCSIDPTQYQQPQVIIQDFLEYMQTAPDQSKGDGPPNDP